MASDFGASSPKTMCRIEMIVNATVMDTECAHASEALPVPRKRGSTRSAKAGSPIQPRASEASVIPSCVAER
jgi:hypothetical protein